MQQLYTLQGIVKRGKSRGKKMGFPTANIPLSENIPEGVYAALVEIEDREYPAATFIGSAKTFNETSIGAESFILNFSGNIYGKQLTIKLLKKIRDSQKFQSEAGLIKRMQQDIFEITTYFRNIKR